MPRTFVWHPVEGPKTDAEERSCTDGQGSHQAGPERHRALVADAPDARGDRPQAPPGRGGQAGSRRRCVDRLKQVRHLVEVTPSRRNDGRKRSGEADREDRPPQPRRRRRARTGTASASAAVRAPARARRRARDTRVSRRARATTARAAASRSSRAARCRSRVGCRSAASRIRSARRSRSFVSTISRSSCPRDEVTPRVARRGRSDPRAKGSGEGAGERRDLAGRHGARRSRSAPARARRSSRPEAASRSNATPMAQWPTTRRGGPEHLPDAGAEGQDHLHAPVPADLPDRRAHHGAGRRRHGADRLLQQSGRTAAVCSACTTCSPAASCRARRCSRSASCRTSRPASSCRSPAR